MDLTKDGKRTISTIMQMKTNRQKNFSNYLSNGCWSRFAIIMKPSINSYLLI
uniref:Uncharacterized protein n=1 Tax=Physcomitrium patens TaxID=3218 RepID=A0A2K1J0R8_PHYPA|nr:hypothetical protein PHYPA_023021 [Physcomitrium patens]